LTHVVRQDGQQLRRARAQEKEGAATGGAPSGPGKRPSNFLHTRGWIQRAPDDKQPDWRHQLGELLPTGSKKVTQADPAEMLVGLYGEVGVRDLVTAVQANQAARAVVKQHGLSGLVALADTRNKQGLNVAAAQQTLTQDPALFERKTLVAREVKIAQQNWLADAGKLLQNVSDWASAEQTRQGAIRIGAVVGLQSAQRDKLVEAIQRLTGVGKLAMPVAGELKQAEDALTEASAKAEKAKKLDQSHDPIDRLEALPLLGATATAATKARDALLNIVDRYDVSAVVQNIDRAATSSQEMENSRQSSGGAINAVINELATAARGVRTLHDNQAILSGAIERIVFLLRSFLEINSALGALKPLTADEVKNIRKAFRMNISDDFDRVFPGSGSESFKLFRSYAYDDDDNRLDQQLAVRDRMQAAGAPAKSPVPDQADTDAFFKSLSSRPNDEAFAAYEAYAAAHFYHRGVANVHDLFVTEEELFAQRQSVTGTRSTVCTGFAVLGARLLTLAGGKLDAFIVGLRASDETLRSPGVLDDGHALAKITRNGSTHFVSNQLIVPTEDAGIGQTAVAWTQPNSRLFKDSGPTLDAAVQNVMVQVEQRRAGLRPRMP
jgi:hypothetical protein